MTKGQKREYDRQYRIRNKERLEIVRHIYYQQHRDSIAAYKRRWYAKNKQRIEKYKSEYRLNNRDKHLAYMKKYYLKNKAAYRIYSRRHHKLFGNPKYKARDMQPRIDYTTPSPSPDNWEEAAEASQQRILSRRGIIT